MSRRLLAAVAAAVLTVGLAACGDGGDGPVTEPPPEINAGSDDGGASDGDGDGATPSDGGGENGSMQAAPDVPPPDPADFAGMDENTPEGAEQAFRYFVSVMIWAHQVGDVDKFAGLYTENCVSCEEIAAEIEDDRSAGNYWSSVEVEDTGIDTFETSTFDVEVGYIFILGKHGEDSGDENVAKQQLTSIGGLNWHADKWMIGDLAIQETAND